ncbi:zinc resistance-associated protein [Desulfocicer vacuolatum DSM 3385]|uniref:Zinc resistance-associated protein n=1 Tax=Desulfocicer vacuolatum DSM 3385 TaxID=1121400 RepID=A0A1W1ZRR4_9BACT|nr:periplasmic heavy metal sensor [Desulfocicer vacuolatum]SMC51109.1 zinc resistance-associated protein [Desulfocicer vacuolatum DSM 3385]
MKKQTFVITAIIFTLMTITPPVFAGNYGDRKHKGNDNCPRYMKGIGQNWAALTQEQQEQLKALHQKFVDETATQRASMISKHEEIRILMETSTPNRDKLITLTSELADAQKTVMEKGIDLALKAKEIAPDLRIHKFFRGMGMFPGKQGFHGPKKMRQRCPQKKTCFGLFAPTPASE